MPTYTTNYHLNRPLVNDPTDEDLWGGYLNDNMDTIDTQLKTASDNATNALARAQLPVGSLYFNASDSTNPATLLGYGTWAAFGQGRVILGVGTGTDGSGDTLAVTAGATGGAYNHTLTAAQVPQLTGTVDGATGLGSGSGKNLANSGLTAGGSLGVTVNAGGGAKHNNTQPWIGVYVWKRTA